MQGNTFGIAFRRIADDLGCAFKHNFFDTAILEVNGVLCMHHTYGLHQVQLSVLPPSCEQLLRVRKVTDMLSMPFCSSGSMMSLASSIA